MLARARARAADAAVLEDRPPGEFVFDRDDTPATPAPPLRPSPALEEPVRSSTTRVQLTAREQKAVMLRVPPETHAELSAAAKRRGVGIGRVAAELILDSLAQQKVGPK